MLWCSCSRPAPSQLPWGFSASCSAGQWIPAPGKHFPLYLTPGHAKPILSVRTPSLTKDHRGKGWDCKNVQYLGLQRKSLWFCPVLRAHGCPWAAVSIPAEPGHSQGGEHTLEDSQERRFPPVGFSQCVDFDFYILCGLSPIWAWYTLRGKSSY